MLSQRFSNILVLSSILFFTYCTAVKQDLRTINYNKEAFKRQKSGDYNGSINVCLEAIKYDPKNSWAHALMGNAYIGLKKYDEALIEFDTAIALNNKNTYYKYCRAFAFEGLRKYDESIADDDYCIAKNYLKACAYNNKGVTKDKVKKYKEALQAYDSCLAAGAYYHQFFRLNKASVFCTLQEYDSALEEVNRCIKQDPLQLSMPAHFKNTSEQNLLLKKDAIMKDTSFLKDIKLYENAYSFKGLLCMMFGKNKDACNSFYHEPAIPLPDYYNLLMRGYFALDNMQYDSAKILIDSSLAVNSENSNTFVGLGLLNTLTRKYEDALAAYNLAINTDSTNPDAFVGRGNMYLQMDNYPAAIADYTTEINLDYRIQNTTAYNARGYAYFLNKQYK